MLKEHFDKFIADNGFRKEGKDFFYKDIYTKNGVFTFYMNWDSDKCKPLSINEGILETVEDMYNDLVRQIDDFGLVPLMAITAAKDTIARFNKLKEELYDKCRVLND